MNKPCILCVDDEKIILDSLKQQLQSQFQSEYLIECAESGEEALLIIKELAAHDQPPWLIISDQIMPRMKGDELLTKVKQEFPKTLHILLTGQG